ncbi:MAG: glycerophosphodiester phosphodiesterase [Actinomycetota bacterium]|nr:glycerophosphodiester phosphodiesterase [Actinomycetota bacterium]
MNQLNRPVVLGHRGASYGRLDNSRAAFEAVRPAGGDGAELDVRATQDGILAVVHDPVVKGYGAIAEHSFAHLSQATGGELLRIEEALEILDGQIVDIEIKSDPKEVGWVPSELTSRLLGRFLQSYSGACEIFVTSFSETALEAFGKVASDYPLGLLTTIGADVPERSKAANALGAAYILPHHSSLDAEAIEGAHDVGLKVFTWTVDVASRISELATFGVDGVITNRIDLALAALGANID